MAAETPNPMDQAREALEKLARWNPDDEGVPRMCRHNYGDWIALDDALDVLQALSTLSAAAPTDDLLKTDEVSRSGAAPTEPEVYRNGQKLPEHVVRDWGERATKIKSALPSGDVVEPWKTSYGVRVGRDRADTTTLVFTKVAGREFQLYKHEARHLRDLLVSALGVPKLPAPAEGGEVCLSRAEAVAIQEALETAWGDPGAREHDLAKACAFMASKLGWEWSPDEPASASPQGEVKKGREPEIPERTRVRNLVRFAQVDMRLRCGREGLHPSAFALEEVERRLELDLLGAPDDSASPQGEAEHLPTKTSDGTDTARSLAGYIASIYGLDATAEDRIHSRIYAYGQDTARAQLTEKERELEIARIIRFGDEARGFKGFEQRLAEATRKIDELGLAYSMEQQDSHAKDRRIAELEAAQAWRHFPEEEPSLEGRPNYAQSIGCIVETDRGSVLAMDWEANPYAKTEKGRKPRWIWRGKLSPWHVVRWMPLPPPAEHPEGGK
jgi:hypothetical protein